MLLRDGGRRISRSRAAAAGAAIVLGLAWLSTGPAASGTQAQEDEASRRAARRIEALQREAEALASRERTLLDELRAFEVEQEIQTGRRREAERRLTGIEAELASTTARIDELDRSATTQRPELAARLVELYKLRNGGYLRLLLSVGHLQEMGRAFRFATAMQQIDTRRIEDYRRTVTELRRSEAALREQQANLERLKAEASTAAQAAARAASARSALIDRIDAQRDLNARLVGELQVARDNLQAAIERLRADPSAAPPAVTLPLAPFRGALDWPVDGRLLSRFGRSNDPQAPASVLNNGVQIGAPAGTDVHAVHDGRVSFAGPFSGFGNLVIIDHGSLSYSLYGQLAEIAVDEGDVLHTGARVGTVGTSVNAEPALYFEMRIDAKPVDPLQWLKKR